MNSQPQLDRSEMIAQFWEAVRERLLTTHKRKADQADLGIGRYRGDTERRGLGEVVYNQGVEHTAEIVNGVIEYGLPTLNHRS
jgi:hypothetical protein